MILNTQKAGLTAAKTVGEWVGIGKGEAKPYTLKINGEEKTVKPVNAEVVNGSYSPLEKTIKSTTPEYKNYVSDKIYELSQVDSEPWNFKEEIPYHTPWPLVQREQGAIANCQPVDGPVVLNINKRLVHDAFKTRSTPSIVTGKQIGRAHV